MQKYFKEQKTEIKRFLIRFLNQKQRDLRQVHGFGSDVCKKITTFIAKGKMIRGGLVALGYSLFKTPVPKQAAEAGAALELVQSGLLIHDDIMDSDFTRRGDASIFYQYTIRAQKHKLTRAAHVGESLGICAGDICFFLAYELLSRIQVPDSVKSGLIRLMSRELSLVATAQMLDVYWGASVKHKISERDILRLYTYKTGRYTFSLPLMFGAVLAQADDKNISTLERIGELLGIIFQIKDDELDLFGDQKQIGKPVGSDIKQGKKNLYYYYLFHAKKYKRYRKLLGIFSSDRISDEQIEQIRSVVRESGIQDKISQKVKELAGLAEKLINTLQATDAQSRQRLLDLLDYNLRRTV
ncbi:MAG: polyprenyl synthetase family protein [Spirochaetales bacterium]|nr:polyprenyl synthetase family protein [Spirochaetales bacterium]